MTTFAARPSVLVCDAVIATSGTPKSRERRQQLHDLVRLAALREHQHDIVGVDAAQVAVKGLGRMQKVGPRAGRGQRGGNLLPDQAGLAHAGDDHAALAGEQQLHGLAERCVEPVRNFPNAAASRRTISRSAELFGLV